MTQIPALVLTAGVGSRLRPLSDIRAKPAVPVAGPTMIERILQWLTSQGITHIVLNLHHKPETITRIVGNGQHLGASIRYSWEDPILGSAGGPRKALALLEGNPILIINGDTLCRLDLPSLLEEHCQSGAKVSMALTTNPDPARYGGVLVNSDGTVTGFAPARFPAPTLHFVGVQLVDRSVLAPLPLDVPLETVNDVYPALIAERRAEIRAVVRQAEFHDIGTVPSYFKVARTLGRREGQPGT
ncbi:MAG: nucleotidyltransferase family protein, partial [Acidimicrobiia bacterium]